MTSLPNGIKQVQDSTDHDIKPYHEKEIRQDVFSRSLILKYEPYMKVKGQDFF